MPDNNIKFTERPIAITDCEMTGFFPSRHELIEIGLLVVRQPDLQILDRFEARIRPGHIETADPQALTVNGYTPELWKDAISLKEAMEQYAAKTRNAIFCSYNICADWVFLADAFEKTGVQHTMDYHMIDIPSIAWEKFRRDEIEKIRLKVLAPMLGIPPEPEVHRAINGAELAHQVLKKLLEK